MLEIEELRQQIDDLDAEIIAKIAKRWEVVRQVREFKSLHTLPVFDPKREEYLREFHAGLCKKYNVSIEFIDKLFELVMQEAKRLQQSA